MKRARFLLLILAIVMIFNAVGCSKEPAASGGVTRNLMTGFVANALESSVDLETEATPMTDFAVNLFKECYDGNTLVSPLSVILALAMTANGAEDETLLQMEQALGMEKSELNLMLKAYRDMLTKDDDAIDVANSVWFTSDERFSVNDSFLQTNADYYGADVFSAPFDNTTLDDINNWVKDKTDGVIPKIIDKIPNNAVMYLVNALAFDAQWQDEYREQQVRDGRFFLENGEDQNAEFMHSTEGQYLENEDCTGFIKYYKDYKYAFAALLPDEDLKIKDFVSSLDGEKLSGILKNPKDCEVRAALPKFETEFGAELSKSLKALGIKRAFDEDRAQFELLGTSSAGNIYMDKVFHKTFISVAEKGTKAGAATVVEMADKSAIPLEEPKTVRLDRPFLYMIIDTQTKTPIFIGTLSSMQ
jgi:serpin B